MPVNDLFDVMHHAFHIYQDLFGPMIPNAFDLSASTTFALCSDLQGDIILDVCVLHIDILIICRSILTFSVLDILQAFSL